MLQLAAVKLQIVLWDNCYENGYENKVSLNQSDQSPKWLLIHSCQISEICNIQIVEVVCRKFSWFHTFLTVCMVPNAIGDRVKIALSCKVIIFHHLLV